LIDLNDENFLLYAAKHYQNKHYLLDEFAEDLLRVKYTKRLIKKYSTNGELKTQLLLNHIIIISNVFGPEATVNILFFRVEEDYYPVLKTILLFLNYMPEEKFTVTFNGKYINPKDITINLDIAEKLRKL